MSKRIVTQQVRISAVCLCRLRRAGLSELHTEILEWSVPNEKSWWTAM
jgi:hypothetical protein